jgi:murein endopeptidase
MQRWHVAWLCLACVACGSNGTRPVASAPKLESSSVPAPPPAPAPPASSERPPPAAGPVADAQYDKDDEDAPEDGAEDLAPVGALPPPPPSGVRPPHPLDGWSSADIEHAVASDPEQLGSVSLGRPGAGAVLNAVQLPEGDGWERIDPAHEWGTRETVDFIERAIAKVREKFPDSHPVYVGHISGKKGGPLKPHVSHQAGRDVDLSYFYSDDSARWYRRATRANLDLARTWAFVRAFVTETDVELILIDASIQKLLREYAVGIGEDPDWVASLFDGVPGKLRPLILHAKGHATHVHVRFFNPVAQETAHRAHAALVRHHLIGAPTAFVLHKVKKGETLGMLARKYGVSVAKIKEANGLRSSLIRAKRTYRIPKQGRVGVPLPVVIPPRRLPPTTPSESARAQN